ncbi:putative DD41D transposase [Trichonephila clavipes]|nr:putative DD41D transposase [Trichonephila clavipes]
MRGEKRRRGDLGPSSLPDWRFFLEDKYRENPVTEGIVGDYPSTIGVIFHSAIAGELSAGSENDRFDWLCNLRSNLSQSWQVIYSQFGLAFPQNDHQARRRFVEWAQNEIAVVPDFHKRILFSDEAHFWLNGYVNKQNCRFWSEANPQVYAETPLHPEKLTVWCALWAGGVLLQKR